MLKRNFLLNYHIIGSRMTDRISTINNTSPRFLTIAIARFLKRGRAFLFDPNSIHLLKVACCKGVISVGVKAFNLVGEDNSEPKIFVTVGVCTKQIAGIKDRSERYTTLH